MRRSMEKPEFTPWKRERTKIMLTQKPEGPYNE
jgi:hypothetical protein